jgi:glucose/arabinose dehydrogenase
VKFRIFPCLALLVFAILPAFLHPACAAVPYSTSGTCGGFPKTGLQSVSGTCVGLVADSLGVPRGVAVVGSKIYVVDAGTGHNHGRLLMLGHSGHDKPVVLLSGLASPTALGFGPGGRLYIVLMGEIGQLNLAANPPTITPVVIGLPGKGQPLTSFVFAPNGTLYVNIGSNTANCETKGNVPPDPEAPCPLLLTHPPHASILKITLTQGAAINAATAPVLATGMRNSEGLAVLPTGQLAAAVNYRDAIGKTNEDEPHDTLDVVQQGADYGWPYCYDNGTPNPAYPSFNCATKHAPTFLLPAHGSPLSLWLYKGSAIPALSHTLLIPFHSNRKNGHSLMAMPLTSSGGLSGQLKPVIDAWDLQPGVHPQGSPTNLTEMPDGSVLITEDHNGTLLRLAKAQ